RFLLPCAAAESPFECPILAEDHGIAGRTSARCSPAANDFARGDRIRGCGLRWRSWFQVTRRKRGDQRSGHHILWLKLQGPPEFLQSFFLEPAGQVMIAQKKAQFGCLGALVACGFKSAELLGVIVNGLVKAAERLPVPARPNVEDG